jgi:hypothetical protein
VRRRLERAINCESGAKPEPRNGVIHTEKIERSTQKDLAVIDEMLSSGCIPHTMEASCAFSNKISESSREESMQDRYWLYQREKGVF